MPPKDKIIEPINASMEAVVEKLVNPPTIKAQNNKLLLPVPGKNPPTPEQGEFDLKIQKQVEIDGVGMGVLSDGTAFLTRNGLARLCGIDGSRITEMSSDWDSHSPRPMTAKVRQILLDRGLPIPDHPYIEIKQRSGAFHAYADIVCLAVLEYYAFDAGSAVREQAQKNYRLLAGKALHDFIYTQVGYDPNHNVPEAWQKFHDRVSLTYNSLKPGYFSIFREIADMIVTLGQAGLHIDDSFVPDISVGLTWGKHWLKHNFDTEYGERIKWPHNYPDYFPQAESNPQEAWCYPDAALGEFRRWVREDYIGGGKFSNYINGKIMQKELPPSFSQIVISAYNLDSQ